jgi:hypothetical protein
MLSINVARGVRVIDRRDEGARKIVPPTKEAMRALLAVADEDFRFLVERHPTPPPSVGISWRNADRRSADRGPDRQRESAFRVPICLATLLASPLVSHWNHGDSQARLKSHFSCCKWQNQRLRHNN